MSFVRTYDFSIPVGGSFPLQVVGKYFRLRSATGPVTVTGSFGELENIVAGQGFDGKKFNGFVIKGASGQAVSGTVIISDDGFVDQTTIVQGGMGIFDGNPFVGSTGDKLLVPGYNGYYGPKPTIGVKRTRGDCLIRRIHFTVNAAASHYSIGIGPGADLEATGGLIDGGGGNFIGLGAIGAFSGANSTGVVSPVTVNASSSDYTTPPSPNPYSALTAMSPSPIFPLRQGAGVGDTVDLKVPIRLGAGKSVYFSLVPARAAPGAPIVGIGFTHFALEVDIA